MYILYPPKSLSSPTRLSIRIDHSRNTPYPTQAFLCPENRPPGTMTCCRQKRTHSVTSSSPESTYLSPAAKRPRTVCVTGTAHPSPFPSSPIECLPTELLQIIFFTCFNGNLLRAAPRIAAKLSGSRSIYGTAFFVAFYHPHLAELRDGFKFDYLLSDSQKVIPSWEVRSMQKIVLDSRWCTYGWFRGLARELLDYAFNVYRDVYATKLDRKVLDKLDKLQKKRKGTLFFGGLDPSGQYIELIMDPFNLSINVWPHKPDVHDEQNEDTCDKAGRWHLQLRGIGFIPFRPIPVQSSYDDNYDDATPFRSLVNEIVWEILQVRGCRANKSDPWEYLEAAMLVAISKRHLLLLQKLLEIHYFFWPEDAPFKLSPRLFAAATRSKCIKVLYLLFQLDPMSFTPTTCKNLYYLARDLKCQSDGHAADERILRRCRRKHIAHRHVYSEEDLRREMQDICYRKDMG
jgi:hypothetical protein